MKLKISNLTKGLHFHIKHLQNHTNALTPNVQHQQNETTNLKIISKPMLHETKALTPHVKHEQHVHQDIHVLQVHVCLFAQSGCSKWKYFYMQPKPP